MLHLFGNLSKRIGVELYFLTRHHSRISWLLCITFVWSVLKADVKHVNMVRLIHNWKQVEREISSFLTYILFHHFVCGSSSLMLRQNTVLRLQLIDMGVVSFNVASIMLWVNIDKSWLKKYVAMVSFLLKILLGNNLNFGYYETDYLALSSCSLFVLC